MNILTDILSLWKRKKFVTQAFPEDVLILGVNTEPDIEGIASPIPYKDVKLIKISDFIDQNECLPVNVPIQAPTINAGVFRDKTTDPLTGECYINFRRFKSISLNLSITENGDFIDFDVTTDFGIWSTVDSLGQKTFYPLYGDALAASAAGDTITLHADVEISTGSGLDLVDGININLNGFTYTYSNPDATDAMTDFLSESPVSMRIYDGVVIRKNSTVTGTPSSTVGLSLSSNGEVECVGLKIINLNGWACVLRIGKLSGLECSGSEGGIFLIGDYELRNCHAIGTAFPGIQSNRYSNGAVFDCIGKSNTSDGIDLSDLYLVSNCIGYAYAADKAGLLLTLCSSENISGWSTLGSGIVIVNGEITGANGRTNAENPGSGTYPNSGIVLHAVRSAQNIAGYSFAKARGLSIIGRGENISTMFISNSSGHSSDLFPTSGGIGIHIKLDDSLDSLFNNDLILQNCSAYSESNACVVEQNPTSFLSDTSFLNCAFTTKDDAGVGINSIGTNNLISYSNCSFKTGNNTSGTSTLAVIQKIANTSDNKGNIHI